MGMGGGGKDAINDINVTPLVDVSLVLVIIFMVTAPMAMQAGIVVSSSQVDAKEGKVSQDESIALRLTKDGIYLNNQPYALEALPPVIASKLKLKAEGKKVVTITSQDEVLHGVMVAVMDISKQAGAEGLSIMREPKLGKLDKSKKKKK